MIFTGDISIPFNGGIDIIGVPIEDQNKIWIGNLEGSLVDADKESLDILLQRRIVFNNTSAIRNLVDILPYYAFDMANNHLLDACDTDESKKNLITLDRFKFGAGSCLAEASKPLILSDQGYEYAIYAFGSRTINCVDATENSEGSNPYNKWHVLEQMRKAVEDYPKKRIIAFMHWNTELELYPQPLDRELSHALINMGIYAIIGCHAHRVQPFEIYKGHPIIYGLGNFAFRQNTYMNGKLRFPEFSYPEITFEIDGNDFFIHEWIYDPQEQVVKYMGKSLITESNAPYAAMSDEEYKLWFKNNRFQNKGITISYFEDSKLISEIKYRYGCLRGGIINLLVKNERLFNATKSIASRIFK